MAYQEPGSLKIESAHSGLSLAAVVFIIVLHLLDEHVVYK